MIPHMAQYEILDVNDDYVLSLYPDHIILGVRRGPGLGRVLWSLQPIPQRWWWPLDRTEITAE